MIKRRRHQARPTAYLIAESAAAPGEEPTVAVRSRLARGDRARARILMCAGVFAFAFAALAFRMASVSFSEPGGAGVHAVAGADAIAPPEIVDRNGALIAMDLPVIALEIAGREVWDARETADAIAGVLPGVDASALAARLAEGAYVELRADLSPGDQARIFALGLPGVRFAARARRVYPNRDLAAHFIGHGEPGRGGVMGLEGALSRGALAFSPRAPFAASLDMRIQQILEDELAAGLHEHRAKAAWGAIMDVATGEIIALASLPDFDPNRPGAAPADQRRNRAVYDRYELGSAFKAITAAAALEAGIAREDTIYDARGSLKVADWRIRDFHGENRMLSFSEVVQHSSNIGIARVAEELGPERLRAAFRTLGLLDPLPMPLKERRAPEPPAKWGPVETATASYGHGIAVTPLHLLAAYSAVVNGGVWRAPQLERGGAGPARRVFSEKTSAVMRRVLRRVIEDGTAAKADVDGLYPIGKTATADKPRAGGYDRGARISSFVGAAPGHAPRYAFLISYDEPQPSKATYGYATAGWNAAPTFARVLERAAPLLRLDAVEEAAARAAFAADPPALEAPAGRAEAAR